MRKPTPEEELKAIHELFWRIDMGRTVMLNQELVVDCLNRISAWVAAHSTGNGERADHEIQQNVNAAFWKHIAQCEPPAKRGPGRPRKEPK
jgi:hypothetical protein